MKTVTEFVTKYQEHRNLHTAARKALLEKENLNQEEIIEHLQHCLEFEEAFAGPFKELAEVLGQFAETVKETAALYQEFLNRAEEESRG